MSAPESVDLFRPLLPEAKYITPYLERIDQTRWYSNFGPLEQEFNERVCAHFGLGKEHGVMASSGTSGLISVMRAMNLPRDSYCLMPSWTFVATAASAIAAEMTPHFVDIDTATWALNPSAVKEAIKTVKGQVGAVVVVAPFGKQIDLAAWDKFSAETTIPVIVDAAAGFDHFRNAKFGKTPVVFSLHATKVMGVGEGGLVISRDTSLLRHVYEQTNFGFFTRHISTPGINNKMSEYTAAVGLAALDIWPERREQWVNTATTYLNHLRPIAEKHKFTIWLDEENVSSTCNIRLAKPEADRVISQLQVRGIKSRQWWDKGCHPQPAYAKYPKGDLTQTELMTASLVSLPYYIDIPEGHIAHTVEKLDKILKNQ